MKVPAIVITRYGGPEVMEVQEVEVPPPGPGQVRVRVHAAGINFAEVFCRLGLYKHAPEPPFVPGFEFAGEIVDIGPGVSGLSPGERVLGVTRFGGYQGGLLADAARVRLIPEGWSYEEAAAFPAAALTAAYGLLEAGRLRSGEQVVIHSAAGGVGSTAVQIAHAVGASVVATAGSDAKLPLLEELGCALVLNYKKGAWADRVRELAGEVDLVFDALGGRYLREGYGLLRHNGRLVSYGLGTMTPSGARPNWLKLAWQYTQIPRFSVFPMISENRTVSGFNVLLLWDQMEILGGLLDRCLDWAEQGKLRPRVSQVRPYTEAGALHAAMQTGKTTGKLVLSFAVE
jgi:alcohol dehydrogenase